MRKFKPKSPLKLTAAIIEKVRLARLANPEPVLVRDEPNREELEATMARAFPKHLRGSISGCCDSMADGHG